MENKQILDAIAELKKLIEVPKAAPSRSDDLKELFTALAKAQGEMKTAGLNAENPFFKSSYSDLTEIVRASRPVLTKNGLSVIQQILSSNEGIHMFHCILAHSSGQWIETRMRISPLKSDIQSLASYITYLRRYTYAAIVGVVTADEDDDAETVMQPVRELTYKMHTMPPKHNIREDNYEVVTKEQVEQLNDELQDHIDIAKQVLDGLNIQSLSDMPKSKFLVAIKRIREIKAVRNK